MSLRKSLPHRQLKIVLALLIITACISTSTVNPAIISVKPIGSLGADITWSAEDFNKDELHLERRIEDGEWTSLGNIKTTDEHFIDKGLQPNQKVTYRLGLIAENSTGVIKGKDAHTISLDVQGAGTLELIASDGGDGNGNDHSIWATPTLVFEDNTTQPLATLTPLEHSVGWEKPRPLGDYEIGDRTYPHSIWAHANSRYVYNIPDNVKRITSVVGIEPEHASSGSVQFTIRWLKMSSATLQTPTLTDSPGGTTYYVDAASGNDKNNGHSPRTAWRTLDNINTTRFAAGDKILFRSGLTHEGPLQLNGHGKAKEPIILGQFGRGSTPVLDCKGIAKIGIEARDARYLQFKGIRVIDSTNSWRNGHYAVVLNLPEFEDASTVEIDGLSLVPRLSEVSGNQPQTILVFEAADKYWDLSKYNTIVWNLDKQNIDKLVVHGKIESKDAGSFRNVISDFTTIRGDAEQSFKLPIIPRPLNPGFQMFRPYLMYVSSMNVEFGTVDPREIHRLTLAVEPVESSDSQILIKGVEAIGEGPTLPVGFFPFVDEFGQYIHGHWHGKVYSKEDFEHLKKLEAEELAASAKPASWSRYGGWANGPKLKATGFFYPAKHNGKWWFVDPEGYLFWSNAPTGVGIWGITPISEREYWYQELPKEPPFDQFYSEGHGARWYYYQNKSYKLYDFSRANLYLKYGENYEEEFAKLAHKRLPAWGFNSIGNWSDLEKICSMRQTPYTVAVHFESREFGWHHDVFDPSFQESLRKVLETPRIQMTANDPWNIGYFVDNEQSWGWEPDGHTLAMRALRSPADQPAKQEFIKDLTAKYNIIAKLNEAWQTDYISWDDILQRTDVPPRERPGVALDYSAFGLKFVDTYFRIVREEVKRIAPNNLYLGVRFHGYIDKTVMKVAAQYCDVISYNLYGESPDSRLNQYIGTIDKPFLSSEWGVGSDYRQTPFGRADDPQQEWDPQSRCDSIARYLDHAIRHPSLVGAHFFQFLDQPITGRPDGEAILRGYLNNADTPNAELIRTNRAFAEIMYKTRAESK